MAWTVHHVSVFILTFAGYAFFHASRKTLGLVKITLVDVWTPTFHNATVRSIQPDQTWNDNHLFQDENSVKIFLGTLDTVFSIAYAVGLYIFGIIGDRFDLRKVLSFGMCSSAILVFLFGTLTEWLHFYSIPYYITIWIFYGLLQATGWPAVVAIMANWFGKSSRGFVLGLWSASPAVGNIIGAALVATISPSGYENAFLVTASVLFAGGIIIFFGLVSSPREVGLPDEDEEVNMPSIDVASPHIKYSPVSNQDDTQEEEEREEDDEEEAGAVPLTPKQERPQAIGFFQALLLPGVMLYSLSFACLKLVTYAFFIWLPFYLSNKFGWSQSVADEISIWYDVGGIIAGTIAGFISDRMKIRSPILVIMLVLSVPALYFYNISPNDKTTNAVLLAVAGFFIGGPSNLITTAISADLGKQGSIQGNKEALSTVAGIVDGTGSVGAAIGQQLVPLIQIHFGWQWVFNLFMLMCSLTVVCLLPILYNEIKSMQCCRRLCVRIRGDTRGVVISVNN